jgi:hypothetical protein
LPTRDAAARRLSEKSPSLSSTSDLFGAKRFVQFAVVADCFHRTTLHRFLAALLSQETNLSGKAATEE